VLIAAHTSSGPRRAATVDDPTSQLHEVHGRRPESLPVLVPTVRTLHNRPECETVAAGLTRTLDPGRPSRPGARRRSGRVLSTSVV